MGHEFFVLNDAYMRRGGRGFCCNVTVCTWFRDADLRRGGDTLKSPMWTRREFAALLTLPALRAQGVSTRNVTPTPRGKPSALPFHAHFTDIAEAAGLRAPVICGGVDRKSYILETVGCGAAFLDYDNDGWLDIFV